MNSRVVRTRRKFQLQTDHSALHCTGGDQGVYYTIGQMLEELVEQTVLCATGKWNMICVNYYC